MSKSITTQHFQAVAEVFRDTQRVYGNPPGLEYMAINLALIYRDSNPRFDDGRFYRACGLPHLDDPGERSTVLTDFHLKLGEVMGHH